MTVEHHAVGTDHHHGVEERGTGEAAVDFVQSDDDRHSAPAGRVLQRLQIPTLDIDCVLPQPGMKFARQRHVGARLQAPDPGRIAGNPRFGKHQQRGAGIGGFVDCLDGLADGAVPVQQHRRL